MLMRDARELSPPASFGELGFELRSWPTRCADFTDDVEVVKTYYGEMMELVKAIDQGSVSVLRILMLQDTRESMRALYQGKGLPDMPSGDDAVLTDEDAAAKEAAEYANRWEAKKKKQREEVK